MLLDKLETDRLRLRSITEQDEAILMGYYGDQEVTKYYLFEDDPVTNCKNGIAKQLWRYETFGVGLAILEDKTNNEFVGMCGLLHQKVNEQFKLEIGYGLLRKHWGNGYAIEAAQFCRDFAFQQSMSDELISMIHPENIPSQQVATRNGMKLTETSTYNSQEMHIYSITKSQWDILRMKS